MGDDSLDEGLERGSLFEAGRCLLIAEVAQAHDGSLGTAHAYIDAIADAGADAVKFQTHIADAESSPDEPWRVKFSYQDETRYDYWKRMEFSEAQWQRLRDHAEERGLVFLSSPFSVEAVQLLRRIGVQGWKVASGQINDAWMLDAMADSKLPLIFSTGMSPLAEVGDAVGWARTRGLEVAVLQCVSSYPNSFEQVGLNVMQHYATKLEVPSGLSDHSGTIYPCLAAAALGASVLELHVTFSRQCFGPDVQASVTLEELSTLAAGVRAIETMHRHPVDKDAVAVEMEAMRHLFMKSIVVTENLPAGTMLEAAHLGSRKPCEGIPAGQRDRVLGARLKRSVSAGAFLQPNDIEAE